MRLSTNGRRRTKSLGALKDPRRTSYGTAESSGQSVSVIHNRRTDPGLLPIFPYLSQIMNNRKSPHDDEATPLYSSYPSVKCDIVEYLWGFVLNMLSLFNERFFLIVPWRRTGQKKFHTQNIRSISQANNWVVASVRSEQVYVQKAKYAKKIT